MSPAARLQSEIPRIIREYRALLDAAASPLTATPERWQACRAQAEAILSECVSQLSKDVPTLHAAVYDTVELGARRAAERVSATESVRAALLLWQASVPVLEEVLPDFPRDLAGGRAPLLVALDALARTLMNRLLYGAVGYTDPGIIEEVLTGLDERGRGAVHPGTVQPGGAGGAVHPGGTVHPGSTVQPASLTAREHQVLAFVAKAMTNHEIGRELGIAETTVKRHLRNIFTKLDATSRMDAIQKAGLAVHLPSPALGARSR